MAAVERMVAAIAPLRALLLARPRGRGRGGGLDGFHPLPANALARLIAAPVEQLLNVLRGDAGA